MARKNYQRYDEDEPAYTPSASLSLTIPQPSKAYLNPNLTLTPALIEAITESIFKGLSLHDSFTLHGIPRATYTKWFKVAQEENTNRITKGIYDTSKDIFCELQMTCEQSLIALQQELISTVYQASRTDWKAAQFLLERIFKDRFQASSTIEQRTIEEQADHSKIEIIITDQTDDNRVAEMERNIARQG
jgi:hypothetical protein